MNETYFQAIVTLLMLAMLIYLVCWLFRGLVNDAYRHKLFTIRDAFFDEALEGKISFSHPAYSYLRDSMNRLIRFSHYNSVWGVIGAIYIYRNHEQTFISEISQSWEDVTEGLDDETLEMLTSYKNRTSEAFLKYLLGFSPEILPLVALIFGLALMLGLFDKLRNLLIASNEAFAYSGNREFV